MAADEVNENTTTAVERKNLKREEAPIVQDTTVTNDGTHGQATQTSPIGRGTEPTNTQERPTFQNHHDWSNRPAVEPHPEAAEIIRQVEFYFSDENLPGDAHLLSRTGPYGDEYVSINEILGFAKMRKFKPPQRVKVALLQSKRLQIKNGKFIRRMEPLKVPLTVEPASSRHRERNKKLMDEPWMTKSMLKPTGFEENYSDPPVAPKEAEAEQERYSEEESFTSRIELAVAHYQSKRKMHQHVLQVLTRFLTFGGFKMGPQQFGGGWKAKDLEEMDKDTIAQLKSQFSVAETVVDGIEPDDGDPTWVVDFETVAKSFLSTDFLSRFDWRDDKTRNDSINVLQNFYNFLLHHSVCPEYEKDIRKAKVVCNMASEELPKLAEVDHVLPGQFNAACSTLFHGYQHSFRPWDPNAEWLHECDKIGMSDEDAWQVFWAGIHAHCDDKTLSEIKLAYKKDPLLKSVPEEEIGLEIVDVEFVKCQQAKGVYDQLSGTFIKPSGKLHCVRWESPQKPPKDLPEDVIAAKLKLKGEKLEFLMDEDILSDCLPGMKIEARVRRLGNGIQWIDSYEYVHPSFFVWLMNEKVLEWKAPGLPKAWQQRQIAINKKDNEVQTEAQAEPAKEEEEDDD